MKRCLLGVLVFLLFLPAMVFAGGYSSPTPEELLQKIEQLTKELKTVKQQLKAVQEQQSEAMDTVDEISEQVEKVAVDGVGRLDISGDYRFRVDSTRAHSKAYYNAADLIAWQMGGMVGAPPKRDSDNIDNDSIYTNRLRLNIKARATENVVFKGRLAMYKIWGMESSAVTATPFGTNGFVWDPNMSRRPHDNTLRVEMAYVNWTNILDLPIWISVGRRPTVDGPPLQLKYNYDKRYATPVALGVDWTFDGATLGYMYTDPFPGKIRICYGRGYESGFKEVDGNTKLDDVDLYGISWDVINDTDENIFANIQFFKAADVPDFMENENFFGEHVNPVTGQVEPNVPTDATANLGDIYHLSGVYMAQFRGIDWFVSAGLSRTDSRGHGFMGAGLLNNPGEDENHWGWATYVGARIPLEQFNSKVGLEYNYGSRYWINFTPAADDLYMSKLATRGHVAEVYWIWDLPETPLSKYGKAFIRAGYQYYWIDYTGSGTWVGKPIDMDDLDDPSNAQMFAPVDRMDNAYLTFEVYF